MEALEAEAKEKGTKYVMGILQRPGQLEKLDQYKLRVIRKKASVETQLKTAMQSQLDGVREGLKLLEVAQNDVKEIKSNMIWVKKSIQNIPDLLKKLQAVKEENMRHSQYETAKHNLKHIFNVPDIVKKTKNWIIEGKLLFAKQSLAELENSRDDLLFELHKLPHTSQADRIMLEMYFEEIGQLSDMIKKQVCLILSRTLNTVRKDPTIIVTALRIIEAEEKADAFHEMRRKQTNFCSAGRPKKWKAMALSVLEEAVSQRIEGTQTDERENHKMWLVRHLELTRLLILEDLRVVKTLCILCFPRSWNIVDTYVRMYHRCLSNHFKEIIQKGLIGNENVSLLSWCLNTYPGPELMSHPELKIDINQYEPLLPESLIDDLEQRYLSDIEANYAEWMKKTLEKEEEDWMKAMPLEDAGYYQSSAPDIVFQIVNQNLEVARTINQKLIDKVLLLSMEQTINFAKLYGEAILQLKNKHFVDRSQNPYYTQHMISIVNNCMQFREFAGRWKSDIRTKETVKVYEKLMQSYLEVRNESVKYLLTEAFRDLYLHFNDLFTPKWLTSSAPVDTICLTFEDYFQDYVHLTTENFEYVISFAQTHVAKCFIYKIMQGKINFGNYEERKEATNKIKAEILQIKSFFHRIAPNVKIDQNFDLIDPLVEIIRVQDPEMLLLDLHELVARFSDITETQLECLLMIRGDLKRSEVRDKVSYILSSRTNQPKDTLIKKSIFSFIGRGNVSMDWDAYWSEYLN